MSRYPSEENVVILSELVQLMHGMAGGNLDFIVHLFTAIIVAWLSQFITMSRLTVPTSRRQLSLVLGGKILPLGASVYLQ